MYVICYLQNMDAIFLNTRTVLHEPRKYWHVQVGRFAGDGKAQLIGYIGPRHGFEQAGIQPVCRKPPVSTISTTYTHNKYSMKHNNVKQLVRNKRKVIVT